jgi:hypothetical protein
LLGRHADSGDYTINAKNKYGTGESSARLDIILRPEIEGMKDISVLPFEETEFVTVVHANPIAEVTWYFNIRFLNVSGFYVLLRRQE